MSKQTKTAVGAVIVAVVALGAIATMGLLTGFLIGVVGVLALMLVLERTEDTLPRDRTRRSRDDRSSDLLDAATSTAEPLTTWTPPESLQPWTPPVDDAPAPPAPPADDAVTTAAGTIDHDFWAAPSERVADFSDLAATDTEQSSPWLDEPVVEESWADGSTWDATGVSVDTNPLDELTDLDQVDVIAEVQRLDEREAPRTSMFDVPAPVFEPVATPVNEAVSTADDIMAASHATELQVHQDDNSELAKLLAKVQARLAAYE